MCWSEFSEKKNDINKKGNLSISFSFGAELNLFISVWICSAIAIGSLYSYFHFQFILVTVNRVSSKLPRRIIRWLFKKLQDKMIMK